MKAEKRLQQQTILLTACGFIINSIYGIGNAILGIFTNSLWLITLSAYYLILSIMRFSVIHYARKNKKNRRENEIFLRNFSGYLFFLLDIVLISTTYLTVTQNIGKEYHAIVMISIAVYTFTKLSFAFINLCKSRKYHSPLLTTIRNIAFADALVSLFSLQRSMLISFSHLKLAQIQFFNTLTGSCVCLTVMALGINLIRKDDTK